MLPWLALGLCGQSIYVMVNRLPWPVDFEPHWFCSGLQWPWDLGRDIIFNKEIWLWQRNLMKTESQSLKQVQTVASAQPTTELALFVVALALPHPEAEATTFKQFQTRFHLISQIFADSLPPGSSCSGPNENVEKSGTTGPRPHMGIPARAEELSSNSKSSKLPKSRNPTIQGHENFARLICHGIPHMPHMPDRTSMLGRNFAAPAFRPLEAALQAALEVLELALAIEDPGLTSWHQPSFLGAEPPAAGPPTSPTAPTAKGAGHSARPAGSQEVEAVAEVGSQVFHEGAATGHRFPSSLECRTKEFDPGLIHPEGSEWGSRPAVAQRCSPPPQIWKGGGTEASACHGVPQSWEISAAWCRLKHKWLTKVRPNETLQAVGLSQRLNIGIHWISFPALKNAISHSPMFKHFDSSKIHANLRSTETINIKTSSGSKPASGSQCQAVQAMPNQVEDSPYWFTAVLPVAPRCSSGLHHFQSRALLGSAIEDHSWCLGQFPHATLDRMTCKKRAKKTFKKHLFLICSSQFH